MKLSLLMLILFPVLLHAETFQAKLVVGGGENGFLRFDNGRVAFLDDQSPVIEAAGTYEVKVDLRSTLRRVRHLDTSSASGKSHSFHARDEFHPSVIPGPARARELFEGLDTSYRRRSECSDRAHVWAHDLYRKHGIRSLKAFTFFTASYINRHRFKWWFHVAPMIRVSFRDRVESLILDHQFLDRPVTVKEWTDLMVFSKRPCRITKSFSEYNVNPQTEDCYLIFESMYYHLPVDLHRRETHTLFRSNFSDSEIQKLRKAAFSGGIQ